jgi:4-carboxymuconolactone decarboxylase
MDSDPERRRLGLETMGKVYGWDFADGPGDWFGLTAEHLFAEIWTRAGLSMRDRRLLLLGLLVGRGQDDVAGLQAGAGLRVGDLTSEDLREVVIFLSYYAGWPAAAKLNSLVESEIAARAEGER